MKHLGDITKIHNPEPVWIVTGGSPCQDLSVAGLRKGMKHVDKGDDETTRSGLFMEQIRIVKEIRENDRRNGRTGQLCRPRFMVWENVPGSLSSNNGEDFRVVLEEIVRIAEPDANVPRPSEPWTNAGAIVGDGWSVAWRIHDAQFWGVPQRRRRIALVADFAGRSATEILFERDGVQGNPSACNGTGEGASRTPADGIGETISFQDRCGCEGGARESSSKETEPEHCQQLTTKRSLQKVYGISPFESNAMKSDNPHSGIYEADTSRTLGTSSDPTCNQGGMVVVDKGISLTEAENSEDDVVLCIDQGGGKSSVSVSRNVSPTLATTHQGEPVVLAYSESGFSKFEQTEEVASLRASGGSNGGGTETLILTK